MKKKLIFLVTLFSVLALALVACGGDDDGSATADELAAVTQRVDDLESRATDLESRATDLESRVTDLEDTMASAPEEPVEEPTAEPTAEPTEEPAPEPTEEPAEETTLGTEENPIVMSFVPSGDTQEILVSGDQLAEMITERTGLVVEANVGTDFAAVREAMGAGQAHIGWLNTFNYVLAAEKYGVDVGLVTQRFGSTSYNGQINVNADAGIESLDDLVGKTMCWVDPNSTSGYIIPRIMLQANGINPDEDFAEQIEAGSHNNVIIQVYNGDCDAGASFVDARSSVEEEYPDVNEKVLVLATTTDIPNDSVSFIADFPEEMRAEIVAALLDIASTPDGQEALNNLYSIEGLQEADDSFYDAFRADLSRAGIDIEELAGG
jgi:phosphonate transport system substrate-binding protein